MTRDGSDGQAAIAVVARHFSADFQMDAHLPRAVLTLPGKQVVVDVATLPPGPPGRDVDPARLREDKVAQRVVHGLEDVLGGQVPRDRSVIVTLGAPIRLANRLLTELTRHISAHLANGAPETEAAIDILGNHVRFRVVEDGSMWRARLTAFVFTGDPRPGDIAQAMRNLREQAVATARRMVPKGAAGERWLVLVPEAPLVDAATYRRALARMVVPSAFTRIVMVSGGRRVELLADTLHP